MLALVVPAHAANIRILAAPGAAGLPVFFPSQTVIVPRGSTATFTNLDVAPHNVKSTTPGLFSSNIIGLGQSAPVNGVSKLKKGKYNFICVVHPNMKGALRVI
jgi:plastocyanin